MSVLLTILSLALFVGIIVVPMLAIWYGSSAFGWGFHNYPKSTAAIALLLVVALVLAGATYRHFFPLCDVHLSGAVTGPC
jgi:hypothetical protein